MCCPLRSFRGQHSEKMKGSARGNCDFREGQQSFRPNPNGVGDRTTTLRWLLIGADKAMSYMNIYTSYTYSYKAMSYINTCAAVIPVKSTGPLAVWILDSGETQKFRWLCRLTLAIYFLVCFILAITCDKSKTKMFKFSLSS